jgi:dTDP-4-dehydrorhamnose 3,5-epimerase
MKFTPISLKGAFLIDLEKMEDSRGFFARLYCSEEFKQHALEPKVVQANDSWSVSKGTLRGLHYQLPPKSETKIVRCLSGSLYDMIIDIRKDSPTFGKSFGTILSAENRRMMYVPRDFAHGFLTLEDNTEIFYLVSEFFSKEHERGIRWNDPFFNLTWPESPKIISDRDLCHPNFDPG